MLDFICSAPLSFIFPLAIIGAIFSVCVAGGVKVCFDYKNS